MFVRGAAHSRFVNYGSDGRIVSAQPNSRELSCGMRKFGPSFSKESFSHTSAVAVFFK
jgi:hypothetical protein